jgi:hypothetical protein
MVGFETASFTEAFATPFAWIRSVTTLGGSVWDLCGAVIYSLPRFWLYGGLVCLAAMYATLVGLGAFTYRTLHANRSANFK